MAILTPTRHRFYNNDGTVAIGGKVYIYEPGTTTAKDSYTTSTQTALNTWPVILDSKGECDLWVDGTYKINVLQSDDVQVTGYPVDNCGGVEVPTTASQIAYTPSGGLVATDVQAALDELEAEKATIVSVNLKADVAGSASQIFNVANGVSGNNAINFSQVFGLGQTWQNMLSSRAEDVVYTNSTGKPILVSIFASTTLSAYAYIYVDAVPVSQSYFVSNGENLSAIVPPGSTYYATSPNTLSFAMWAELR